MVQSDDEACDYPFSIRIPKSLAQDISRRAASEGLKASAWARKALEYSLYEMGSDERRISAAGLIELIKYDSGVQSALWDMFNEFMNSEMVLCDEDGNRVDVVDTPVSSLKRMKAFLHPGREQIELPEKIDPVYVEHRKKSSKASKADRRIPAKSETTRIDIDTSGNHRNVC